MNIVELFSERKRRMPPEADSDFDVVEDAKISEWRDKLSERFGIGIGKMTAIDGPASVA